MPEVTSSGGRIWKISDYESTPYKRHEYVYVNLKDVSQVEDLLNRRMILAQHSLYLPDVDGGISKYSEKWDVPLGTDLPEYGDPIFWDGDIEFLDGVPIVPEEGIWIRINIGTEYWYYFSYSENKIHANDIYRSPEHFLECFTTYYLDNGEKIYIDECPTDGRMGSLARRVWFTYYDSEPTVRGVLFPVLKYDNDENRTDVEGLFCLDS